MRTHLTDKSIKTYRTGHYWDDHTPGLGVRVGKHAKTWIIMRGREREKITLGRYPSLSLSDARTEAKKLLSQSPEAKVETVVFREAKTQFVEEHYRDRSPRMKHEANRHLTKHFATLDPKPLPDIDDGHIKTCLDKLKHVPSEQLHAYRVIRCFLKWCTRPPRKFMKHSPMEGYEPPSKDRKGTRTLTDQELKAIWKAADGPTTRVVRLLVLWGTRQTETASTERLWAMNEVLTIPGAYTKNGRDHAIPLLPLAKQELARCPSGKHYFPSRWGDSHLQDGSWSKIKREIQLKSGTKNWQLRDIRRTFRSNMARLKVPRELCEVLINHAPAALDEIYDRYDRLPEKREALLRYERWLQTLLKT